MRSFLAPSCWSLEVVNGGGGGGPRRFFRVSPPPNGAVSPAFPRGEVGGVGRRGGGSPPHLLADLPDPERAVLHGFPEEESLLPRPEPHLLSPRLHKLRGELGGHAARAARGERPVLLGDERDGLLLSFPEDLHGDGPDP